MAIPTTYAPVYPQDFLLNPVKVHKSFVLIGSDFETTSSGYSLTEGYYTSKKTPIGAFEALNDPVNLSNNTYKHIIWKHIDHMYYRHPYDQYRTTEHHNKRFTSKFLYVTCSMLSIPYMDYGESIRKNSVELFNSDLGITLKDDGYGNLYDVQLQHDLYSSSYLDRRNLIGYFGFNDLYRNFKFNYGVISNGESKYQSSRFSPTETYKIKNVRFSAGVDISGSDTGIAAEFEGNGSYIQIHNRPDFDFDNLDQFTISFWAYVQSGSEGSIISKRGTIFRDTKGYQDKVLSTTGHIVKDNYISSSFVNSYTDVYPYDISYSNNLLNFKRSDGIHTIHLTGSLVTGSWNHISIVRHTYGEESKCALFINNSFIQQTIDSTKNPINNYEILLGSSNLLGNDSFTGKLDELRFYNTSFVTGSNVSGSTLHTNLFNKRYLYNTSVVGNVFYRRGNIVITSLDPTYSTIVSGSNWQLTYDGTHTIYEYSVLCRIKKGDFNLTMNPTARKSPKSDMLINDLTGSLMKPYFTTIGMYNDKGDLLAVAKMGQPVMVRDDVDVNVWVKWDG